MESNQSSLKIPAVYAAGILVFRLFLLSTGHCAFPKNPIIGIRQTSLFFGPN
ncbi:hypothetical protein C943_03821 [Mariniradius saccharolyticus AK6]|uniref:Uncharacterized protein n=1 Tax=Mariniradius saccharolyticus AK6 TaxID=1239962 RepID=M7X9B8_9BACT|nr:hypothetical protein C943_03821 [Mariniradius saccharolyticus AK6]